MFGNTSSNISAVDMQVWAWLSNMYERYIYFIADGSIKELGEEFSGSKIQYGWCKVTDSNTNLPKLVLINWVSFLRSKLKNTSTRNIDINE